MSAAFASAFGMSTLAPPDPLTQLKTPSATDIALLAEWNASTGGVLTPDASLDITARYVLRMLSQNATRALTCPPMPAAESCRDARLSSARAADARLSSARATAPEQKRGRLLLLIHLPWFASYTGHLRAWALIHRMQYPCLFPLLSIRMRLLVRPGEVEGCARICRSVCECALARHERAYHHRNVIEHASGDESILFAHADVWLNLPALVRHIDRHPFASLSPHAGLQGTSFKPTRSKCVPREHLDEEADWFWHDGSKQGCVAANLELNHRVREMRLRAGELDGVWGGGAPADARSLGGFAAWNASWQCCYGWVDVFFLPRDVHALFRHAARAFWDVQLEVAVPTIFKSFEVAGLAPWRTFDCHGGCCHKLMWAQVKHRTMCAHRTNLEAATISGIPAHLHPPQLCHAEFTAYRLPPNPARGRGGGGRGGGGVAASRGAPARQGRPGKKKVVETVLWQGPAQRGAGRGRGRSRQGEIAKREFLMRAAGRAGRGSPAAPRRIG